MKIGLLFNRARGYGRNFCLGVAAWAEERDDWQLEMIPPDASKATLTKYDGIIAHIIDERDQERFTNLDAAIVADFYRTSQHGFAQALPDHEAIGALAAKHFIERGYTDFAFCGYDGVLFSDKRRDGFVKELALHSYKVCEYRATRKMCEKIGTDIILNENLSTNPPDGARLAKWLKSLSPGTAIFCAHDLRAIQVIATAKRCSLRVPEDLAVLGTDNDNLVCSFTKPKLSSVDNNGYGCGLAAAACLDDLFTGKADKSTIRLVPPIGVAVRQSSAGYRYPTKAVNEALEFMRSNLSRNLTASMVFDHVGLTHTSLDRRFKQEVGRTVHAELARLRIEEAKRLLAMTALPFGEIALRCGFAGRKYFSDIFNAAPR